MPGMLQSARKLACPVRVIGLLALGLLMGAAQQAEPPAPAAPAEAGDQCQGLQAQLQAPAALFNPDSPIWVRFNLINATDQPITLPLAYAIAGGGGVTLPLQLVLGHGPERPLTVTYEAEAPKEVPPPNSPTNPPEDAITGVRLAAHGVLGTQIDLRDYYPAVRYPGRYRIDWRPLGGRLGVCSTEFRVELRKDVIMVTDLGKMTFVIDYEGAPRNVENFLELVRSGFYNGSTFHRVIPGFIIQGGCSKGDGTGVRPDNKLVAAELRDIPVETGTLLMAHRPSDPDSASSQFFIALVRLKDLDGQYTVIGQAHDAASLRTLQQIAAVRTDTRDHPIDPLILRSVNLVDSDLERSRAVELRRHDSATSPSLFEVATRPANSRAPEPASQPAVAGS
jgi:peptidyl-prolyl cis-trans isomerase B (cyclophilin B)